MGIFPIKRIIAFGGSIETPTIEVCPDMGRHTGEVQESDATCLSCGESYSAERAKLGYRVCLACGEKNAKLVKHTVVPLHKSNYILVRDRTLLRGINVKGSRD